MYNLNLYNTKVEHNNMVYSVDKLRLKTYISYFDFTELEFFIKTCHKEKIKRFWVSDKINSFHYNYNIEIEEGKSFSFHFMHNQECINYNNDKIEYNFTIEFNPNKLRNDILLCSILDRFSNWLLRSYDLAIDIPINILDIIVYKGRKRIYKIFSEGEDKLTYYIGTKGNDGFLKVYNKKHESDLKHLVGYLTRVEITRRYEEDFPLASIKNYNYGEQFLPILYLNQYAFSFSDITTKDKTLMAVLYAVQTGYSLNDLSRDYKKKIKNLLELGSRIRFDNVSATQAFNKCIFNYFMRKTSKQYFA